jgi:ribonuclease Z
VDLTVLFLGTGGSAPAANRGMPALLVRRGGDRLLFDCGEGTQRQLVRSVGLLELDCIFITHLHADHWLGLPGLLKTYDLQERSRPLLLFGPPGLKEALGAMRIAWGKKSLCYDLIVRELEPLERVARDGYGVSAIPVAHRGVTYGYAIVEDPRPGRFDPDRAKALGIQPGPDFGRLQRGEVVGGVRPEQVLGPPRLGRKVVISGDTAPCEPLRVAADRADLLIHEATFLEEDRQRAQETGHATARQAAELGAACQVKLLALVHHSGRYPARAVREEAQAVFPPAVVPRDFDLIEVPYPERGGPRLLGGEGRVPAAPADTVPDRVL